MTEDDKNNGKPKATLTLLEIPDTLKLRGINGIAYGGSFMSVDYKGQLFPFTVYKGDITKTLNTFDKMIDSQMDGQTKSDVMGLIASHWTRYVYTTEVMEREALEGDGKLDMVLEVAQANCKEIFIDEYKAAHAAVMINDRLEVLPIADERFKNWLRKIVRKEFEMIVGTSVIEEAVNQLTADAYFDGQTRQLGLRFATDAKDEFKWYYDLTNDNWEFIEISSEGWKTVKNQIIFRRFNHQSPQVSPEANYPLDIFDQFMNLLNVKKEDRLLLKCYVVATFIPNLLKTVLMVHGEQGTAKSMLEELLIMLIDPTLTRTLTIPRSTEELIRELSHHALAYYDNLSTIPGWVSDLLCRAVTGSGFSKRKLYTDNGDIIYVLQRAIGFNGINLAATRADLLSRGLIIQTESISKENRRRMRAIWKEFDEMKPQLLGYILDILVKVLQWKKDNQGIELVKNYPRMADWAEWCEIIAHCMGEKERAFMKAYSDNINLQTQEVIEGSDVAIALQIFIDLFPDWSGSATDLLEKLHGVATSNNIDTKNRYWPKTANRLSRTLKILQQTLREIDIEITWDHEPNRKRARILKLKKLSSASSNRPQAQNHAQNDSADDRTIADDTLRELRDSEPPKRPPGYNT
jgi:hypothetical protein